jgi:hypothetical protein
MSLSWPRASATTYDNPQFGSSHSAFDWLEYKYTGGEVVARTIGNDCVLARLTCSTTGDPHDILPISLAFGFLTGTRVQVLAKEMNDGHSITRALCLPARGQARNRFSPPLSDHPQFRAYCEPMLSRATEFFSTDVGKRAGNLLHMCHSSTGSTFTIHALVVCVVLESLVKLLVRRATTRKSSITEQQKDKIISSIEEIGLSSRTVDRFKGFIGKLDEVSPKNQLHSWAEQEVLGIDREDVKAWDRLRNRAAHGRLLMDGTSRPEEQITWTALRRVKNIVNKLLLNAMQYEGNYYDYAECQMKGFACTSLQDG